MKELYTKPVSEVNEFSQTADVITTSGTDWGFGGNDKSDTLIKAFGDGRNAVSFCVLKP